MKPASSIFFLAVATTSYGGSALAGESKSYSYDALGRLVAVTSTGTINDGRATTYCYDSAGNRTRYVSNTSGAAASCVTSQACQLTAYDVETTDEFSALPRVEKSAPCSQNVTLSYSIQHVSGPGSYSDGGFWGGSTLLSSETYKGVWIYPVPQSVPMGQQLVLKVTFSSSTPGVSISPAVSYVTINSSY